LLPRLASATRKPSSWCVSRTRRGPVTSSRSTASAPGTCCRRWSRGCATRKPTSRRSRARQVRALDPIPCSALFHYHTAHCSLCRSRPACGRFPARLPARARARGSIVTAEPGRCVSGHRPRTTPGQPGAGTGGQISGRRSRHRAVRVTASCVRFRNRSSNSVSLAENFAQHGTITLRAFGIIRTRSGNGIVSDSPSAPTGIDRSQPTIRLVARPVLI
jgi:hypothetical protein